MQESMSELNERLENERKQKEDAKLEAEYERFICYVQTLLTFKFVETN